MPLIRSMVVGLVAACLALRAGAALAAQVGALSAIHHDGQTFLSWRVPQIETGWTFRVYSANQPIATASDLAGATLMATVGDSSWYDRRLSVITGAVYGYAVDSLAPAADASQGLCVITPLTDGSRYYAVTSQLGKEPEDRGLSPGDDALVAPVVEHVGTPRPIYQHALLIPGLPAPVQVYALWTSRQATPSFPAMANRDGMVFDCAVVPGSVTPRGSLLVTLHQRGGNFLVGLSGSGQPGEWVLAPDDPVPDGGDTFWYGYHENYDVTRNDNPVPTTGTVRDYTLERLLYTLAWARRSLPVDTTRVYASGGSMGGIGSFSLAFRHPELFAAIFTVVPKFNFAFLTDPNPLNAFNTGGGLRAYTDALWGTVATNLPCSDGVPIYQSLNDGSLAVADYASGIPPVIAFNGKNDVIVGWAEKIGFYDTMRAQRLGGYFFWDMRDHLGNDAAWFPMQSAQYLYRFRTDRSYPALSRCAADGNPGDGHAASGDSIGCINAFVEWDTVLVDQADRWEVTLTLRDLQTAQAVVPAPDSTTVDVTPRRLQRFPMSAGGTYSYLVTRVADGVAIGSGLAIADSAGVLTIPQVPVPREGCHLRIDYPAAAASARSAPRGESRHSRAGAAGGSPR